MKAIKLSKKQLNMEPVDLLVSLGLIDEEKKQAFPEKVFLSKQDYKRIEKNTRKKFKKKYNYLNERAILPSVGMYMLNYGPCQSLEDAIKPGYALVESE